jgi:non-ribosomal peptide synthetase component F
VSDDLRAFARASRTTLFSVFLALYYVLLHTRTRQTDLTVASFFANRGRPELQLTVGFLANMLALRTAVDSTGSFTDLVAQTRRTVLDAVVHQAVPVQMLSLPSLLHSTGRLNDIVFQMLPDRGPKAWTPTPLPGGAEIDTFRPPQALSRFGLNLTMIPRGGRVEARLSYDRNRFEPGWTDHFLGDLAATAATVLDHPDRPLVDALGRLDRTAS